MTQRLWQPSQSRIEQANLWRFIQAINASQHTNIINYEQLHQWSISHSEQFWDQIWHTSKLVSSHKGEVVLNHDDPMQSAKWYPQAKLNFAANLLKFRHDSSALIYSGKDGARQEISYAQLFQRVA